MSRPTDHAGFLRAEAPEPGHWWGRRWPSIAVLAALLAVTTVVTVGLAGRAADVLPEVGKDQLGADNWSDPLGVHLAADFQVARVPDCAAGAFTRLVLWDPESQPYWEVEGPPTPFTSFLVGVAPEGFTTVTPYRDPPRGEVLRLVAFRRDGGPVGIRYQATDLRPTRVVSGNPLVRFTIEGFQTARVCEDAEADPSATPGPAAADQDDPAGVGSTAPVPGGRSTTTIDDGTGTGTG
ncbi:MAG: hypothetical protein KA758_14285 [Acidimicrobiales bacterium]|nr:hypothetical protein [Acidimicrobiales bacterium]